MQNPFFKKETGHIYKLGVGTAHGYVFWRTLFKLLQLVLSEAVWIHFLFPKSELGFPSGLDSKESAWNAGDPGSIPTSGRYPGGKALIHWNNSTFVISLLPPSTPDHLSELWHISFKYTWKPILRGISGRLGLVIWFWTTQFLMEWIYPPHVRQ